MCNKPDYLRHHSVSLKALPCWQAIFKSKRIAAFLTLLVLLATTLSGNPLNYYRKHFEEQPEHPLKDTLFEKTVWHRKVSHLVIEQRRDKYRVTLLMIMPYPYNYKSQNYPVYYEYQKAHKAREKLVWLDKFLRRYGVLRISLDGSKITSEKVLFSGYEEHSLPALEIQGDKEIFN